MIILITLMMTKIIKMIGTYDIETLNNFFSLVYKDRDTKEFKEFIIHSSRNDLDSLVSFLKKCNGLIGFNNVRFDAQVIEYILRNYDHFKEYDGDKLSRIIYAFAQQVIFSEFAPYKEWELSIPQCDLFLIWHFNNKARRTSLKDVQFALGWYNVEDMPISHEKEITVEDIPTIMKYNRNDTDSTDYFYRITKGEINSHPLYRGDDKIDLRNKLSKKYGLDFTNCNNGKIGVELILDLYSKRINIPKKEIRTWRTFRSEINLGELILPYIKFESKEFSNLLEKIKSKTIKSTKGEFKYSVRYKGIKYDYGTGGIHASIDSGIYISDDNYIIIDADVASLYPSIAVINGLYPEHLGIIFKEIYENDIVKVRLDEKSKPKSEQDKTIISGLKESANIPYGC